MSELKRYTRHITMTSTNVMTVTVGARSEEEAEALIHKKAAEGCYDDEAQEIHDQSGGWQLGELWQEDEDDNGTELEGDEDEDEEGDDAED